MTRKPKRPFPLPPWRVCYDMSNIMEYYHTLDNEDKERLLYWIVKEMSKARARIWLSTQKYAHERASKVV